MRKEKRPRIHRESKRYIVIWTFLLILLLLIVDISPLGGNLAFYLKWQSCGQRPVQLASKPGHKWYEDSPLLSIPRTQVWMCSAYDAEKAGYSSSELEWSYPHLNEKHIQDPIVR